MNWQEVYADIELQVATISYQTPVILFKRRALPAVLPIMFRQRTCARLEPDEFGS